MSRARILIVLGLAAAATWLVLGPLRHRSETVRYREAVIARGPIASRVSATGTLNPVDQVEVGSQVSGIIQSLYADYNSRVTAGQVLARIDPSLFKAQKSQAEANLEKARANAEDGKRALDRARELKAKGLVSQAELDGAETTSRSRLADVRQAEAALELAQVNLEHTTIISPISGVVISRSVDVGQTVAASLQAPRLFQIAKDLAEMQLEARVDEADIGQVRDGQPVSFTVDSYPDEAFEGRVLQIRAEPISESGVVSYVTVVRVPNPQGKLRPGMTANVTIVTAQRESAILVPNAALRFRPRSDGGRAAGGRGAMASGAESRGGGRGGRGAEGAPGRGEAARDREHGALADGRGLPAAEPKRVWVLDPAKGPVAVPVTTGITDGTVTELLEGPLQEGAKVVVGELDPEARGGGAPPNPLGGGVRPGGGAQRRGR